MKRKQATQDFKVWKMETTLYRIIRADGVESNATPSLNEAKDWLDKSPNGTCLIAETYEYTDSDCLAFKGEHGCGLQLLGKL